MLSNLFGKKNEDATSHTRVLVCTLGMQEQGFSNPSTEDFEVLRKSYPSAQQQVFESFPQFRQFLSKTPFDYVHIHATFDELWEWLGTDGTSVHVDKITQTLIQYQVKWVWFASESTPKMLESKRPPNIKLPIQMMITAERKKEFFKIALSKLVLALSTGQTLSAAWSISFQPRVEGEYPSSLPVCLFAPNLGEMKFPV